VLIATKRLLPLIEKLAAEVESGSESLPRVLHNNRVELGNWMRSIEQYHHHHARTHARTGPRACVDAFFRLRTGRREATLGKRLRVWPLLPGRTCSACRLRLALMTVPPHIILSFCRHQPDPCSL
jgi:hypothetical protein